MPTHGEKKTIAGKTYVYQKGTGQNGKGWWKRLTHNVSHIAKSANNFAKKNHIFSRAGALAQELGVKDKRVIAGTAIAKQAGYGKPKANCKCNPWIAHLKKYQAAHPSKSYSQCMTDAKATYTKQKGKGVYLPGHF